MNTSQLEFGSAQAAAPAGKSQNEKLRDYFLARPGVWIPMPVLAKVMTATGVGAPVHARVGDVRKRYNMAIINRTTRPNGVTHSSYRYEPGEITPQN